MPTPLILKICSYELTSEVTVSVNGLAPALNTMPLTSIVMASETKIPVTFETSKVAVSPGPLGTVGGVQLVAVNQLLPAGLRLQVALPAKALPPAESRNRSVGAANSERSRLRLQKGDRLTELVKQFLIINNLSLIVNAPAFAVSPREEGQVAWLESPNELDATAEFQLRKRPSSLKV